MRAPTIVATTIAVRREAWSLALDGDRVRLALRTSRSMPAVEEIAGLAPTEVTVDLAALPQMTSTVIAWLFALHRRLGRVPLVVRGLQPFDRAVLHRVGAERFLRLG